MALVFGTATRRKAKLRLAILAPAGGGKTKGALKIARGLAEWDKVYVLDSERGSASLYANDGPFKVAELDEYNPQKYIDGIKAAEEAGAEVIIIDSLSHAWAGTGGTLDLKGAAEAKSGNGWTAWRNVTPLHNALVEAMLQSKCHVIATMRVKMEYVQEKDVAGKTVIKKVGLQPVQREGLEYEFTTLFDVDVEHFATCAKDRTGLFDTRRFKIDESIGTELKTWLDSGADALPQQEAPKPADLSAAADLLPPHASRLQAATTLDELKAAWEATPSNLRPALASVKDAVKAYIKGDK